MKKSIFVLSADVIHHPYPTLNQRHYTEPSFQPVLDGHSPHAMLSAKDETIHAREYSYRDPQTGQRTRISIGWSEELKGVLGLPLEVIDTQERRISELEEEKREYQVFLDTKADMQHSLADEKMARNVAFVESERLRVVMEHQEDRHTAFVESVTSMTFLDRVRFAITGVLE